MYVIYLNTPLFYLDTLLLYLDTIPSHQTQR